MSFDHQYGALAKAAFKVAGGVLWLMFIPYIKLMRASALFVDTKTRSATWSSFEVVA